MAEPLNLKTLAISAGATPIVSVSLTAGPGEITTLMGPSGSGKSSILAAITGTLPEGLSATGDILLGTQNLATLPAWKRRIGILFQDDLLFPHLSVGGNLALGLAPQRPIRAKGLFHGRHRLPAQVGKQANGRLLHQLVFGVGEGCAMQVYPGWMVGSELCLRHLVKRPGTMEEGKNGHEGIVKRQDAG